MAVYVTGDYHGGERFRLTEEAWPEGYRLTGDDIVVVAGDFGLPWFFSDREKGEIEWLESRPWTTVFIDGNHENFGYWEERPAEEWRGGRVQRLREGSRIRRLMRGQVYDLDGFSVFTMGGATSVDRAWRVPGISWWPQELPDECDFSEADTALAERGWRVDYVVTHACSTRMLPRALYPDDAFRHPDSDRLTDYLDTLEDRLEFGRWYCGHYHVNRDLDDLHTVLYDRIVPLGEGVW